MYNRNSKNLKNASWKSEFSYVYQVSWLPDLSFLATETKQIQFFDTLVSVVCGKIKFFKKSKKNLIDKLNLLMCSKYHDYWMFCWPYVTGGMECVIFDHFEPYMPLTGNKIKILQKKKRNQNLWLLVVLLGTYHWLTDGK